MSADLHRHPLSAAFGDMPKDEFDELVADIKRNGLITPIVTLDGMILDGWHRYRACLEAGVKPRFDPFDYAVEPADEQSGRKMTPAEFVVSANAHRRHLTREQRRQIVVELLKAKPEASDRAIASMAKVDHKTVGAVRREAEAGGEIPHLTERVGKDGKKQPAPSVRMANPEQSARALVDKCNGRELVKFYGELGYALHQRGMLSNWPEAMLEAVGKELDREVRAEFERRHPDLLAKLEQQQEKARDEMLLWQERSKHMDDYMSFDEFRLVRSCLHPDREADPDRKKRAFEIFNRLETRVNPDARRLKHKDWREKFRSAMNATRRAA